MTYIYPAPSQVTSHRHRAETTKEPTTQAAHRVLLEHPQGMPRLAMLLFSTRHRKRRVSCTESGTELRTKAPTGWPGRDSERSGKRRLLSCQLRDQTARYGVKSTKNHCQLRVDSAARVSYIKPCTITHTSREVKRE